MQDVANVKHHASQLAKLLAQLVTKSAKIIKKTEGSGLPLLFS